MEAYDSKEVEFILTETNLRFLTNRSTSTIDCLNPKDVLARFHHVLHKVSLTREVNKRLWRLLEISSSP
jgi:hypothetical protein